LQITRTLLIEIKGASVGGLFSCAMRARDPCQGDASVFPVILTGMPLKFDLWRDNSMWYDSPEGLDFDLVSRGVMKMTTATMKAQIVRVRVEEGKAGLFYATSPDLKGLLVAEATMDGLEREIPKAIAALYAACDVEVVVTKAEDGDDDLTPWVAVPVVVAASALARASQA
jgi:hypothetical protein